MIWRKMASENLSRQRMSRAAEKIHCADGGSAQVLGGIVILEENYGTEKKSVWSSGGAFENSVWR